MNKFEHTEDVNLDFNATKNNEIKIPDDFKIPSNEVDRLIKASLVTGSDQGIYGMGGKSIIIIDSNFLDRRIKWTTGTKGENYEYSARYMKNEGLAFQKLTIQQDGGPTTVISITKDNINIETEITNPEQGLVLDKTTNIMDPNWKNHQVRIVIEKVDNYRTELGEKKRYFYNNEVIDEERYNQLHQQAVENEQKLYGYNYCL